MAKNSPIQTKHFTVNISVSISCVMFAPSMRTLYRLNRIIANGVAEMAFALGLGLGIASFVLPIWMAISKHPLYAIALVASWPATKLFGAVGVAIHDAAKRSVA